MEQPNFRNLGSTPFERLVSDALAELQRLGYSRRSRNRYRTVWQHLIEYCDRNKLGMSFVGIWRSAFWRSIASVGIWKRRARGGASISCGV